MNAARSPVVDIALTGGRIALRSEGFLWCVRPIALSWSRNLPPGTGAPVTPWACQPDRLAQRRRGDITMMIFRATTSAFAAVTSEVGVMDLPGAAAQADLVP